MNKKILIVLVVVVLVFLGLWLSGSLLVCKIIYGKNICYYYEVRDGRWDKSSENYERLMTFCREMTNVPKKDKCFILIVEGFSGEPAMAIRACDAVMEFEGVHTKEKCLCKASLETV